MTTEQTSPSTQKARSGNLELKFVLLTFFITTTIVILSCIGIYFLHQKGVLRVAEKEFAATTVSVNIPLQHLFKHSTEHYEEYQPIIQPFIDEILLANNENLKALFIHDHHQQVLLATSKLLPTEVENINFRVFRSNPTHIIDDELMVITIPMKLHSRDYYLSGIFSLAGHFNAVRTNLIQPLIYIGSTYILILVILAFIVSKKMIKPLKLLNRAIKQSFPGSQKKQFHTTKLNEFGELEELFHSLLEHLESHHREEQATHTKLLQADKLVTIGTLAAGVAHEVNNPITGMQSCMAHLKKHCSDDEKALRYIDPVDQSILHIKNAVKGLLDYSKVRSYSYVPTTITEVLESVIRVVQPQLNKKRIALTINNPNDHAKGQWDSNALSQVFMNLILNAIFAIESESGSIQISATRKSNVLMIALTDTGPGIPEDVMHKIFQPFYTTKAQGQGTGLGLAMCKNIIEAHRGTITAQSTQSTGATFLITLPLLPEGTV